MNSSYNKSRIVEDGWKTVFRNSVPAIFNCMLFKQNNRIAQAPQDSLQQFKHSKRKVKLGQETSRLGTNVHIPLSSLPTDISSTEGKQSLQNEQIEVSVISKPEIDLSSLNYDSTQATGEPVQSTSNRDTSTEKTREITNSDENSTLDSKTTCNKSSLRKSGRLCRGEELLRNMVLHISNEDAYIHYFRQLIELDNLAKNRKTDDIQKIEIIPFNKIHTSKTCKLKKSNKIKNVKSDTVLTKGNIMNSQSSKTRPLEEITLKVNFTVEQLNRIHLRAEVLYGFDIYCDDDELCGNFIERLIDFEEELLTD